MNYYFRVLKKYAVFNGRARRKEYWTFVLINIVIALALGFIEGFTGINSESNDSLFVSIYQLAVLLPSIAVGVRRMHDVDKSGWNLLIPIYSWGLLLKNGMKGENKYGPDPKEENEKLETTPDLKDKLESIFCYKCGQALEQDSKFCTKCGVEVIHPFEK